MIKKYYAWKKYAKAELEKIRGKESLKLILIKFFLPIILSFVAAFIIYLTGPELYTKLLYLLGFYLFTPLGISVGIPFGVGLGINILIIVAFMLLVDCLCSMFIIWNLNYIKILPFFGKIIKKIEEKTALMLKKNGRIEKLEFLGVLLFVVVPVYWSGAIIGSFVGKILSMKPQKIWTAVIIGSLIRLTIIALIVTGLINLLF